MYVRIYIYICMCMKHSIHQYNVHAKRRNLIMCHACVYMPYACLYVCVHICIYICMYIKHIICQYTMHAMPQESIQVSNFCIHAICMSICMYIYKYIYVCITNTSYANTTGTQCHSHLLMTHACVYVPYVCMYVYMYICICHTYVGVYIYVHVSYM